jgi:hypothetical protein
MTNDRFMLIHDPELRARGERVLGDEFRAMSERVLEVTELTSRLNLLPFDDEAGRAALLEQIVGGPLPARVTIYPPSTPITACAWTWRQPPAPHPNPGHGLMSG